jgi:hypothetical protein
MIITLLRLVNLKSKTKKKKKTFFNEFKLTGVNFWNKVKAFTEIGYGPETRPLKVSTSVETPIPHLVIFTSNLLWLADLDNHASLNQSLGTLFKKECKSNSQLLLYFYFYLIL